MLHSGSLRIVLKYEFSKIEERALKILNNALPLNILRP